MQKPGSLVESDTRVRFHFKNGLFFAAMTIINVVMKTIGDLFAALEKMEFFAGDVSLKNADAYIALKKHLKHGMAEHITAQYVDGVNNSRQNKDVQEDEGMHFEKRDLNEAEEY